MNQPATAPDALARFRKRFSGDVVLPADPAYDDARRVWNGMIDRRPAIVVRPIDANDVVAAIQLARIAEPYSRTGRYVNDVGDSGPDLGRWVYGDAKYDRLVAVKRAWDPDNVFRLNQNIRP